MSKQQIVKIGIVVSICIAALLSVLPLQMAGADNRAWMSALADQREINTLAIPGTHDSGATHSIADLSGKCQSLSIDEQLELGVRFFDIRLQMKNNKLVVVHSFVDQATDFDDVLDDMKKFLDDNQLVLFWTCMGEKQCFNGTNSWDQNWSEWSSFVYLDENDEIVGNYHQIDNTQ